MRPDAFDRERVSGIVIPDSVARPPWVGTVLAVGPGAVSNRGRLTPTGLNVGDRVTFARGLGVKWESDSGEVIIMAADAVIGRVK